MGVLENGQVERRLRRRMKRKFLNVLALMLMGVVFVTVGVLTAAEPPEEITIENKGYDKDKKGPVKFHHKKHSTDYKDACTDCHHDYKDGKNVWKKGDPVKKCSACHDPNEKKGKVDKLQNAYHKNCKDCHKKAVEEGRSKKAPFKKCNECHEKAEK
jgi:Class III cytochrome C family